MNTQKLFTLIVLMFLFTGLQAKKVCIVKDRKDATICVNRTFNRASANLVVVVTKNRNLSGSNVWVLTDRKDAEMKVYFSNTPEKIKVFISENNYDGNTHKGHTPGTKKGIRSVSKAL